jgi:antitoxin (DNA-binding transcriptional repressor) of toxin-antitoxin stability system
MEIHMSSASIKEVEGQFSEIVHNLRPGQSISITENGSVVAILSAPTPLKTGKRLAGIWKNKAKILAEDDDHLQGFPDVRQ